MMASLCRELSIYGWACESLMKDAVPFTQEELEWIGYYATEVSNLSDERVRLRRLTVSHKRQTLRNYAAASRALLFANGLFEREKDLVRLLTSEVMREILGKQTEEKAK